MSDAQNRFKRARTPSGGSAVQNVTSVGVNKCL